MEDAFKLNVNPLNHQYLSYETLITTSIYQQLN
jgi:hypothetical protein